MAMALGSQRKRYSERPTVASDQSASPDAAKDSGNDSNLFSKGPIANSSFRSKGDGSMRNMPLVTGGQQVLKGNRSYDKEASAPAATPAPTAPVADQAASAPAASQDTVYSTLPYQVPTTPVADSATPTAPVPDSSMTNDVAYEQPYHIYDDKAPTGIMGLLGGMNQAGYQPQYMPTAQQAYQNQNVQGSAYGAGYNPYAQQQPSFGGMGMGMSGGPYGGINPQMQAPQQNSWTTPQQPQANSWGNQGASATPGGYGQGQQAQGPNIFGGGINPNANQPAQGPNIFGGGINPNANQQSQIQYQGGPGPQQGDGTPGNPFAW